MLESLEQVLRGASVTYSALRFASALQRGKLMPDEWRGTPLCCAQYSRLFGCARIPQARHRFLLRMPEPGGVGVCAARIYRARRT
eukprot:SAG11_NODE_119_length_15911_cov_7.077599_8_plen_85_part_00